MFPGPLGKKKSHKAAKHSGGRKWGATTDADEIWQDWARHPDANVGIVTGPLSGFFVVEADTSEGHGVDGLAILAALEAKYGRLPILSRRRVRPDRGTSTFAGPRGSRSRTAQAKSRRASMSGETAAW